MALMKAERTAVLLPLALSCVSALADGATRDLTQAPPASMLRSPDIGPKDIVFGFAGDLWLVDKRGGTARPLTNARGPESSPKFSPDGTRVAFVGGYEGNRDLYVLPTGGGEPQRVTHHPTSEGLCDWNGDALTFVTGDLGGLTRQARLFQVPAAGGMPTALPVPYGANAAVDRTGEWLAYTPHAIDNRTWKRYRGGMATDVWLLNLKTGESRRVTDWEGIDTLPMWHGDALYFLSDQGEGHRLNVFRFDLRTGARTQVTRFTDEDVRWPSVGPDDDGAGEIVFQKGEKLMCSTSAAARRARSRCRCRATVPRSRSEPLTSRAISASGRSGPAVVARWSARAATCGPCRRRTARRVHSPTPTACSSAILRGARTASGSPSSTTPRASTNCA
jgi:tricorn protease